MRTKLSLLLIAAFSLGFVLHWFITSTQVQLASPSGGPANLLQQNVLGQASQDQFITSIVYDGKKFKPSSVTVKKGNYLAITNKSSDQLMWLISDNADLQTARGYGEGEKLQVILLKEGEFKVVNKLTPTVSLVVKVE